MANPFYQTVSTTGPQAPFMCDFHTSQFQLGIAVILNAGAVTTYTVEYTYDDPANIFPNSQGVTPTWFSLTALAAKSATLDNNISFPIRAIRVNPASLTGGTLRFIVIQSGITSNA